MLSGIYKITIGERCYIGSTDNFVRRAREHESALRFGRHRSKLLQEAWDSRVVDAFDFQIIERVSLDKLAAKELEWIKAGQPKLNAHVSSRAPMRGRKHRPESIAKYNESIANSPAFKANTARLNASKKGVPLSVEHRAKVGASIKGIKRSPGTKSKLSVALKGKVRSPEHCASILKAKLGKKLGPQSPAHAAHSRKGGKK